MAVIFQNNLKFFFGFGQSAEIDIRLDDASTRKCVATRVDDGTRQNLYLFYDGETIAGTVHVRLKKPNQKLDHNGIKIDFIGQIEVYFDRGTHHDFTYLSKDLAKPGELLQNTEYHFEFLNVEKPYESYVGANVKLRYFLRVTIARRLTDIVKEMDIVVHVLSTYPDTNNNCLHIEFEYNKSKYHVKDVIVGKIYFLLVRIKIKYMEIAILKREIVGSGTPANVFNETEVIAKYEIMDGAPVKGETIPIRLFLSGYDLTYRRYFKQQVRVFTSLMCLIKKLLFPRKFACALTLSDQFL
ncbi:unnamed protein product [Soboliphyme baturini]|uniref:Vacuolar protein sorting-associated protein 26 n=1 Tax=Soboliphyme baturini TaxID=241478 RepID=A0A3P8E3G5_9BILA|nr:unnamed protein product [Soboliphyme baturini]